MKWFVASDIHGSAFYCRKMLQAYDREGADRMLLLGDLLYHGPRNDLPEGYDPREVARLLNERRESILCVRGNCDAEVDQMVLAFPVMADFCILCVEDQVIYAAHGHLCGEEDPPPLQPGDILLCGHTHVPKDADHGSYRYLNPGSVSLPKEGSHRGYMTIADGRISWKDLEGNQILSKELKRKQPQPSRF